MTLASAGNVSPSCASGKGNVPSGIICECKVPNCSFKGPEPEFDRHWTEVHEPKVTYLICAFCCIGCIDEDELREHLDFFHGVEDRLEMQELLSRVRLEKRKNIRYILPGGLTKNSAMNKLYYDDILSDEQDEGCLEDDVQRCREYGCSYTGANDDFIVHWTSQHMSDLAFLRCPICAQTYLKQSELLYHLGKMHMKNRDRLVSDKSAPRGSSDLSEGYWATPNDNMSSVTMNIGESSIGYKIPTLGSAALRTEAQQAQQLRTSFLRDTSMFPNVQSNRDKVSAQQEYVQSSKPQHKSQHQAQGQIASPSQRQETITGGSPNRAQTSSGEHGQKPVTSEKGPPVSSKGQASNTASGQDITSSSSTLEAFAEVLATQLKNQLMAMQTANEPLQLPTKALLESLLVPKPQAPVSPRQEDPIHPRPQVSARPQEMHPPMQHQAMKLPSQPHQSSVPEQMLPQHMPVLSQQQMQQQHMPVSASPGQIHQQPDPQGQVQPVAVPFSQPQQSLPVPSSGPHHQPSPVPRPIHPQQQLQAGPRVSHPSSVPPMRQQQPPFQHQQQFLPVSSPNHPQAVQGQPIPASSQSFQPTLPVVSQQQQPLPWQSQQTFMQGSSQLQQAAQPIAFQQTQVPRSLPQMPGQTPVNPHQMSMQNMPQQVRPMSLQNPVQNTTLVSSLNVPVQTPVQRIPQPVQAPVQRLPPPVSNLQPSVAPPQIVQYPLPISQNRPRSQPVTHVVNTAAHMDQSMAVRHNVVQQQHMYPVTRTQDAMFPTGQVFQQPFATSRPLANQQHELVRSETSVAGPVKKVGQILVDRQFGNTRKDEPKPVAAPVVSQAPGRTRSKSPTHQKNVQSPVSKPKSVNVTSQVKPNQTLKTSQDARSPAPISQSKNVNVTSQVKQSHMSKTSQNAQAQASVSKPKDVDVTSRVKQSQTKTSQVARAPAPIGKSNVISQVKQSQTSKTSQDARTQASVSKSKEVDVTSQVKQSQTLKTSQDAPAEKSTSKQSKSSITEKKADGHADLLEKIKERTFILKSLEIQSKVVRWNFWPQKAKTVSPGLPNKRRKGKCFKSPQIHIRSFKFRNTSSVLNFLKWSEKAIMSLEQANVTARMKLYTSKWESINVSEEIEVLSDIDTEEVSSEDETAMEKVDVSNNYQILKSLEENTQVLNWPEWPKNVAANFPEQGDKLGTETLSFEPPKVVVPSFEPPGKMKVRKFLKWAERSMGILEKANLCARKKMTAFIETEKNKSPLKKKSRRARRLKKIPRNDCKLEEVSSDENLDNLEDNIDQKLSEMRNKAKIDQRLVKRSRVHPTASLRRPVGTAEPRREEGMQVKVTRPGRGMPSMEVLKSKSRFRTQDLRQKLQLARQLEAADDREHLREVEVYGSEKRYPVEEFDKDTVHNIRPDYRPELDEREHPMDAFYRRVPREEMATTGRFERDDDRRRDVYDDRRHMDVEDSFRDESRTQRMQYVQGPEDFERDRRRYRSEDVGQREFREMEGFRDRMSRRDASNRSGSVRSDEVGWQDGRPDRHERQVLMNRDWDKERVIIESDDRRSPIRGHMHDLDPRPRHGSPRLEDLRDRLSHQDNLTYLAKMQDEYLQHLGHAVVDDVHMEQERFVRLDWQDELRKDRYLREDDHFRERPVQIIERDFERRAADIHEEYDRRTQISDTFRRERSDNFREGSYERRYIREEESEERRKPFSYGSREAMLDDLNSDRLSVRSGNSEKLRQEVNIRSSRGGGIRDDRHSGDELSKNTVSDRQRISDSPQMSDNWQQVRAHALAQSMRFSGGQNRTDSDRQSVRSGSSDRSQSVDGRRADGSSAPSRTSTRKRRAVCDKD